MLHQKLLLLVVFDFQLLTARLEQEKIPETFSAIYWCVFRIHEVWPESGALSRVLENFTNTL